MMGPMLYGLKNQDLTDNKRRLKWDEKENEKQKRGSLRELNRERIKVDSENVSNAFTAGDFSRSLLS